MRSRDNGVMIIDAHVHYTPPALREQLPQMGEPYWELLLNSPQSIQGWISAEKMLSDMDEAGIDKVILVGEYFQQHANCVARNNVVLDLVNWHPDRIAAFAIVNPAAGAVAVTEVERCLDAGMIGVGELNFYAQNFTLTTPALRDICHLCDEHDVPINLHGSEPVGGYYLGKSTTPLHVYFQLAAQYPSLKLIYAHWGGGLLFYEMMPRTRKTLANVYYDTAASPLLYPTSRIFPTALTCIPAHKIIYGSDYPLKIYPRKMAEPDFTTFLAAIRKYVPEQSLQAQILGGNITQLLAQQLPKSVDMTPPVGDEIVGMMAVQTAVNVWPETEGIFGRYHIPTHTTNWEPISQAAAVQGLTPSQLHELLAELNAVTIS